MLLPLGPALPLLGDVADLILGRACLGCDTPGPSLCADCLAALRGAPIVLPATGRMPSTVASTRYVGLAQQVVIAYKEHANRSLAAPLGLMLADAVGVISRRDELPGVTLVPIPGHPGGGRGFDALGGVARQASARLADRGTAAPVRRLLRPANDYSPLKGLGRDERFARVAGAFRFAPPGRARPVERANPIIIVDDVVTTGATATEAVRVLSGSGLHVVGIAVVAATPAGRRHAV